MSSLARKKRNFIIVALIIPTVLLICFVVFPAIDLFKMSFTNWDGISASSDFIWFDNYKSMFHNVDLWQSLRNNAVYFVVHLCMIPVELAFAVLLTSRLKAAKFYKTMVFMPYIINGVAISYAFSYFFSPVNGAFDAILKALHMGMLSGHGWLSDPGIVNFVLAFVSLWRFSGYHVVLFMAALQSLPQDVQEAARVDGANKIQTFFRITIPMMGSMFQTITALCIMNALKLFDSVKALTNGGPGNSTEVMTMYIYRYFFETMGTAQQGYASAISILSTVLVMFITLLYIRATKNMNY